MKQKFIYPIIATSLLLTACNDQTKNDNKEHTTTENKTIESTTEQPTTEIVTTETVSIQKPVDTSPVYKTYPLITVEKSSDGEIFTIKYKDQNKIKTITSPSKYVQELKAYDDKNTIRIYKDQSILIQRVSENKMPSSFDATVVSKKIIN